MRVFSITDVSNFIGNELIKDFHACMFHGWAERDGKGFPHDTKVWANSEAPSNLMVSRTVRNIPNVCRPSTHLVVCNRLAEQLQNVPGTRILPVIFKRLVEIEYAKGDMTWDRYGDCDPRELLRTMPDVAEFHGKIGTYSEIQTWRLKDVVDRYESCREIEIESGTPPMEETVTICVSEQIMHDYPILYETGRSVLVEESVFEVLDDCIDRDFFIVRTFEV